MGNFLLWSGLKGHFWIITWWAFHNFSLKFWSNWVKRFSAYFISWFSDYSGHCGIILISSTRVGYEVILRSFLRSFSVLLDVIFYFWIGSNWFQNLLCIQIWPMPKFKKIWPNLGAQEFETSLKDPSLTDDFLQIFVLMLKLKIFRFVDTDDVDIIKTFKIFEFQIKFYNLDKVGSS